jgi:hypothetical protein
MQRAGCKNKSHWHTTSMCFRRKTAAAHDHACRFPARFSEEEQVKIREWLPY